MHKRIQLFLIALLICTSLLSFNVSASTDANGGFDINYWYSDANAAGTWTDTLFTVYVHSSSSYSSLSSSNLNSYLTTATTSWSCVDFTYYTVNTQPSAEIVLRGTTRSDATSFQIPSDVVGATINTTNHIGSLYYGSSTKEHHIISASKIFLIESDATATTSGARKVAIHEIGHAPGYFGHYANGNVMKPYYENVTTTTPSTNEQNHIGQLYN